MARRGRASTHIDLIAYAAIATRRKVCARVPRVLWQSRHPPFALADMTGDSLKLAREATKVESPVIVFCGVLFMAETAKMLNPSKKVLLPDLKAGCSLVDSCPPEKLHRYQEMLRANGRKFQTVTYINSSAAVKALSDWVVTSNGTGWMP